MAKKIIFNEDARQALMRGVDKVANAVRITIGPRGRNVIYDRGFGSPMISNDGVSIAKEITLSDKMENMGAEIVKEVAQKTNDTAGDGTTTAIVLTQAIVREGMKQTTMGVNAMGVKLGIITAKDEVVKALRDMAKEIKTKEEMMQVATLAAESEELGRIIADTIHKVGKDGVVTVEESQSLFVESEIVEGMQFDKGYVSPYMITNPERMEAVARDCPILITDKKISNIQEILPLLEKIAQSGRKELVIIADEVEGEALATFVVNKLRGTFNILAVKAPGYGDRKKEMLEDIAVVVGAKVVSEELGIKLETAGLDVLGRAGKVIATKDNTTIVSGKGKKTEIEKRLAELKKLRQMSDSKFDIEKIDERIAKLSGGVAVIKVGAPTETEMKYLKLKVEDAVNATKAAIEEGIVPGGGSALIKAAAKVRSKKLVPTVASFAKEFEVGVKILLSALEAPLKQIAVNAGREDGSVIVEKVRRGKGNVGYDALKDEIVPDMIKAGIIDPVKVTRSCVENASSAGALLLTTEVAIAEEPKKDPSAGGPSMGGMGMGDY